MDNRPVQFGIRTLIVALLVSAFILAIVVASQRPGQIRNRLKTEVEKLGGKMWVADNGSAISFKGVAITDSDIEHLAPLIRRCDLWALDLSHTKITDQSIPTLETLKNHKLYINLNGTGLSNSDRHRVGDLMIPEEEAVNQRGVDPDLEFGDN